MLFLDEIHRMSRSAEEMLYLAMEDFRVDVIVGKGPGATAIPLELPAVHRRRGHHPGRAAARAAARPVRLHRPPRLLRRRRPGHDPRAVGPAARGRRPTPTASPRSPGGRAAHPASPTGCCAGCATGPRCTARHVVDEEAAHAALALFDVDDRGLDRLDRAVLDSLCRRFGGGPVGLSTLAVAVGEEADTVETVAEPFLVREGFITRTPRGRAATALAWQHLGLDAPGRLTRPSPACRSTPARAASAADAATVRPRHTRAVGAAKVTIGTRARWGTLVGMPCVTYTRAVTRPESGTCACPTAWRRTQPAPTRRDCSMTLGMPATLTAVTAAGVRP